MYILEFQCKECDHNFTRLLKSKEEVDEILSKKEKCSNCGGETKLVEKIDMNNLKLGCDSCSDCSGCKNR